MYLYNMKEMWPRFKFMAGVDCVRASSGRYDITGTKENDLIQLKDDLFVYYDSVFVRLMYNEQSGSRPASQVTSCL